MFPTASTGDYSTHCKHNVYVSILQAHTACLSDCALDVQTRGGALLHYDFSPLSNVTDFHSSPRFTSKGLRYFHRFNVGLCGKEVRRSEPDGDVFVKQFD